MKESSLIEATLEAALASFGFDFSIVCHYIIVPILWATMIQRHNRSPVPKLYEYNRPRISFHALIT